MLHCIILYRLPHDMSVPGMGQRRYFESSLSSGGSMCTCRACSFTVRTIICTYVMCERRSKSKIDMRKIVSALGVQAADWGSIPLLTRVVGPSIYLYLFLRVSLSCTHTVSHTLSVSHTLAASIHQYCTCNHRCPYNTVHYSAVQ